MKGAFKILLRAMLVASLALIAANPATAEDAPLTPVCLANADATAPVENILSRNIAWRCNDDPLALAQMDVDHEAERVLILFASDGSAANDPRYFVTRLGQFERLSLAMKAADGSWDIEHLASDDVAGMPTEPSIVAPLPELAGPFSETIVVLDRPSHAPMALNAELHSSDPSKDPSVQYGLIIIAVLLGMVILPIVFDITFYRVLRQQFLVWHIAMAASFAVLLAARSGIINVLYPVSLESWRLLLIMGLTASIASSLMFMRSFIEPGKLSPWALRAIPWIAVFSFVLTGLHALSIPILRPISTTLHSVGVITAYVMLTFVILQSVWRRSRAGLFVFVGWVPIMVSTWGSIFSHLTPFSLPTDMLTAMYVGMLTEMIATAAGVGDRFMTIKRERDLARAEATELDELSNSDPLTGLLNRRAIDARFEELRDKGYNTAAVLDLDNFKRVNDTCGHDTGDNVLRVVSSVLEQGKDCEAFRLGGEEFLLLMRGNQTQQRAEALRQSIPVRIARDVDGLDHMVTASMGLVVVAPGTLPNAQFNDIYRYADRLLYEAKESGRNRMVSENLRAFRRRSGDRRKQEAA